MSTLPLYLNEQKVTIDQLSGNNYLVGYPELVQLMLAHNKDPALGFSNPLSNPFIYAIPGKQSIYASRGRSWQAGQRLRAYKSGNTAQWLTLLVNDYNKLTGKLSFEVVAASYFDMTQPNFYMLTPYYPEYINSTILTTANGGTGADNIDDARTNLGFMSHRGLISQFTDFITKNAFARRLMTVSSILTDEGAAFDTVETTSIDTYDVHSGILLLNPNNNQLGIAATTDGVFFGNPIFHDWTDFGGVGTIFECEFMIPALSVIAGNGFLFECGLVGSTAKLICAYADNVNTARFTYASGISSSFTTFNTTLTVAINTWYRFRMEVVGSNIVFTINAAQSNSVAVASFVSPLTGGNRMSPFCRVSTTHGNGGGVYIDYMQFKKVVTR